MLVLGLLLHGFRDGEIIDRIFDAILQRSEIVQGFDREIEREALRRRALIVRHADPREQFELFDVDQVGHGRRRKFGGGHRPVNAGEPS